MIGKRFTHPKRIILLVLDDDDRQHAIEIWDGTASWEFTGQTADGQSTGTVTASGRMHRTARDAIEDRQVDLTGLAAGQPPIEIG